MLSTPSPRVASEKPPADYRAEAARYALLRRLAPSIRHHLVVNLQPIGMIYEVTERRLRAAEPDLASVHENMQRINGFTKAALGACSDVVSWLAPSEEACVTVNEGVQECFGLLATSLSFRGYALRNQVDAPTGQVRLPAIRCVLTAALLHVTDHLPPPADLVLTAVNRPQGVDLLLRLQASDDKSHCFSPEPAYRVLGWDDLEAVARAEAVEVAREEGAGVRMSIPWALPPAA